MNSIQFCMTICLFSFDSMIYLNQLYDPEKMEKNECIQNPGTLAMYSSQLENKIKMCAVLFCQALYFMAKILHRLYGKIDTCLMIIESSCCIVYAYKFRYNSWFPEKLLNEIKILLNIYNLL